MIIRIPLLFAGLLSLFILPFNGAIADSHGMMVGKLEITGAWARATPPSAKNGGAFLTVSNHGATADKLISASTDAAKKTELHNHINDNGVMRMRQVPHIDVPMHGQAVLKPGSYHVMMMGVKAPLVDGSSIMVKLTFEKAGDVMVHMPVKKAGGAMKKMMKHN
ncbi:MAG: copper chaperone PCu(A)C [Rhodospirillaceae bacterium]|jgi:periplasmic copper chaperone A|nr:copper chaperone PCu(A)C [Rhodospirillaceae bacterium]